MASSIHHGPPGSFKSFTLVQRFVIDALQQGRVVVTNVRGLTSIDRIQDQFPDLKFPDSADLWYVDTEVAEQRKWMAGWFHWVPLRALVVIDECQRIYPNRRDFKSESLDAPIYPTGFVPDEITIEIHDDYTGFISTVHRPEDVLTAFDMQRHFQWDIFLSTPNIEKVKDFIRQSSETAYRHKSLSGKLPEPLAKLFGLFNSWYEFQHDPENSGKYATNIIGKPRKYKADEPVFRCYQSTATGEHTASKADQSILGDPKLKFLLFVMVLAIGTLVYSFANWSNTHKSGSTSNSTASPVPAADHSGGGSPVHRDSKNRALAASGDGSNYVPVQQAARFFDNLGHHLLLIAYHRMSDRDHAHLSFVSDSVDGLVNVSYSDLFAAGVRVSVHGLCSLALIAPDGSVLNLACHSSRVRACSASVDSADLVIRRDCYKYGDPKPKSIPEQQIPQNALVATASQIVPVDVPAASSRAER